MPIRHIVVLMLENRSFDHMVGLLQSPEYPINGPGQSTNPADCKVQGAQSFPVTNRAQYTTSPDPGHEFPDVDVQLFCEHPRPAGVPARNQGFVKDYTTKPKADGPTIMDVAEEVDRAPIDFAGQL